MEAAIVRQNNLSRVVVTSALLSAIRIRTTRYPMRDLLLEYFETYVKANLLSWKRSYRYLMNNVIDFYGGYDLTEVTNRSVEEFKARLIRTHAGIKRTSINRNLEALRAALNWLRRTDEDLPVPKLEIKMYSESDIHETHAFNPLQVMKMLKYAISRLPFSRYLLTFMMIGLNTGMRPGNNLGLKRCNVNFHENIIQLPKTKNGKVKRIKLNSVLRRYLLSVPHDSEYWVSRNGEPIKSIRTAFRNMLEALGMYRKGVTRGYCLRHTFATKARVQGVDLQTIAKMLGVTLEMVERYSEVSDEWLSESMERASFAPPKSLNQEKAK